MESPSPVARDVKVFVPAKDLSLSCRFYAALGWTINWESEGLIEMELADSRFYLQRFYAREWAENFMIDIAVEDAAAWYRHAKKIIDSGAYPGTRVNEPKRESYGAMVTHVWDPCGVLLHFTEPLPPDSEGEAT